MSLTSVTCKILKHIVHSSVLTHFDRFNVLCDNQHGFRKKRSCETKLIVTIHEIAKQLSCGSPVTEILLDFEKAFDNVSHARLLHKLDFYSIRGNLKAWIGSFLSGRKQKVVLDGCKSTEAEVLSGIPQGTVLGPLLFLAFINNLPDWAKHSDTRLFADDALLFRQIKGQKDAELLQQDLTALEEWEKTWQMSFHASKCTVIRIPPQRKKLL